MAIKTPAELLQDISTYITNKVGKIRRAEHGSVTRDIVESFDSLIDTLSGEINQEIEDRAEADNLLQEQINNCLTEVPDNSVGIAELKNELNGTGEIGESNIINWNAGINFSKVLTADTIFTMSNLFAGKSISVVLEGEHAYSLPLYCKPIDGSGVYDGTVKNLFEFKCTSSATNNELVWYSVTKAAV